LAKKMTQIGIGVEKGKDDAHLVINTGRPYLVQPHPQRKKRSSFLYFIVTLLTVCVIFLTISQIVWLVRSHIWLNTTPGHVGEFDAQSFEEYEDQWLYVSMANVTDWDLQNVSGKMWLADNNSLSDNQYTINRSGNPFFKSVDTSAFGPTFQVFKKLLDNYIHELGTPDLNNAVHQREQIDFLNAIMVTEPMKILHDFLAEKGYANSSKSDFIEQLKQYWFTPYNRTRGGPLDSSGFEHVFVGEIDNRKPTNIKVFGFHGWVNFYLEEKAGNLSNTQHKATCQPRTESFTSMNWLGYNKTSLSMFVGTSPEYEFAVFTLCFVIRPDLDCPINTTTANGTYTGNILSYKMRAYHIPTISSVFPQC